MGERIKTDFDMKEKKSIPGPGSYKLNGTEIGNKGLYVLSTLKYFFLHLETQGRQDIMKVSVSINQNLRISSQFLKQHVWIFSFRRHLGEGSGKIPSFKV